LMLAVVLAHGSVPKAIAMIVVGILLSTVGTDLETGEERLTFGWTEISDGIDFAVVAMGVFGFAEILRNLESPEARDVVKGNIGKLLPTPAELRQSAAPIARGTLLGSILGILPGNGAVLAPFASYTVEKKLAADPDRFGEGAIEGVAGPEAANNAGAQTAFIPLLVLGIPPNAVMALMLGAMTIKNIVPGPEVMTKQPALFWGMVASMWLGNLMLLIINLPLIGLWVRLLKVPYRLLFPAIVLFCSIGIYSIGNNPLDIYLAAAFGLFGYALIKFGFEPAPLLLGFVLGRLMEERMRQALARVRGDFWTFVQEPLSLAFLIASLILVIIAVLPAMRRGREKAFAE
jgi:putative tricarboxylic transport membrane protein